MNPHANSVAEYIANGIAAAATDSKYPLIKRTIKSNQDRTAAVDPDILTWNACAVDLCI